MHSAPRAAPVRILETLRMNRGVCFLAVVFLAGMIIGSVYARGAGYGSLQRLDFLFASNFKARASMSFLSVFTASFASSFLFVFACFLCGLSMWGILPVPLLILFRGFGLGLTSGYLYSVQGWKGAGYYLLVLLPGACLCSLAILSAALEGMKCSYAFISRGKRQSGEAIFSQEYLLQFGKILGWIFAAAVLDTALSALFGSMFSF